ncbi:hypothetical protein EVG20_g1429 [Dentipellis fragilis]|uniref:Carboxylesterase type B domain-containing protein n=1 Tax=Dentipellis fragilis TaxID=205917 RepID=A0A4Y9ZAM3_9AGAM|nr:hypothetical protein EVG20_g1429 [Dentipellis fragilis]
MGGCRPRPGADNLDGSFRVSLSTYHRHLMRSPLWSEEGQWLSDHYSLICLAASESSVIDVYESCSNDREAPSLVPSFLNQHALFQNDAFDFERPPPEAEEKLRLRRLRTPEVPLFHTASIPRTSQASPSVCITSHVIIELVSEALKSPLRRRFHHVHRLWMPRQFSIVPHWGHQVLGHPTACIRPTSNNIATRTLSELLEFDYPNTAALLPYLSDPVDVTNIHKYWQKTATTMGFTSPLTLLYAFAALASLASAAQVKLGNTTFVGMDYPQFHQEFFGAIPFALPPVGARRFRPPVPLPSLGGDATYDATNYGPSCIQIGLDLNVTSEDCLTLNVFRPAGLEPNASLAVMVWIYGGAFQFGTTEQYNASLLVSQSINRGTPIIFVSANYRVGPFGFPQGSEAEAAGLLNVGLRDQLTALEWVQANIRTFGGDPQKVTVFGQSAGSMSIAHHYLNDISSVARGVIFESGWGPTLPLFNTSHWALIWTNFAGSTPACMSSSSFSPTNTLDCLQAGTAADLAAALTNDLGIPRLFIPVLDGPHGVIPDYPTARAVPGAGGRVPFISGTVLDDGTLFTPERISSTGEIAAALLAVYLPAPPYIRTINNLIALYPDDPAQGSPFFTGNETFGLSPVYKRAAALGDDQNIDSVQMATDEDSEFCYAVTDLTFFGLRRFFGQTAASVGTKVYSYWFTQPIPDSTMPRAGVRHGAEVPYVFGTPSFGGEEQIDQTLSTAMMDYWISFAVTLDPNDGKGSKPDTETAGPVWQPYEATGGRVIQLNAANLSMVPDDFHKNQTDFLALESTHRAFSQ